MFLSSIPKYLQDEVENTPEGNSDMSDTGNQSFIKKLEQIKVAIVNEMEMYDYLKDLKKQNNQNKRMPVKRLAHL
jgi:hypothetical protein